MARKMKKFSAGGAQGRYDRRMADIEKDYKKAAARKTGKDAEVAEAKRQQRIADAKDDLAKRTGADRTATRAAEKAAEGNLTKTRKYGAAQSVTKDTAGPTGKVTDTLGALTAPKSGLATAPAKKAEVKKAAPKPSAADIKRNEFFQDSLKKTNFKSSARRAEAPIAPSKFDKAAFDKLKAGTGSAKPSADAAKSKSPVNAGRSPGFLSGLFKGTNKRFEESQEAKYDKRKSSPLISGSDTDAIFTYGDAAAKKNAANKAKGGKIMKYAKGGSTPTNKKPKTPKEPITGGANTVPLTPERKEFLKELAKRNAKPGMAKGGKATKFGAAMTKKSADTKGRAMVKKCSGGSMKKYAKGGSIDGCAVRGKTKGKMLASGGSCGMTKGRK